MKAIDVKLTGVDINDGVGYHLRSLQSLAFNRILGEYLSAAYMFFYFVIALAYLVPYFSSTQHAFDQITTGLILAYLSCLVLYPIFPTTGPFWSYPDKRPIGSEIGYIFAPLSQYLVKNNSAIGTAFPSSHCAITTVVQILTLVHHRLLGIMFLSFCPAILVATVWLEYHYLIDSIVGFLLGCVCASIIICYERYISKRQHMYDIESENRSQSGSYYSCDSGSGSECSACSCSQCNSVEEPLISNTST